MITVYAGRDNGDVLVQFTLPALEMLVIQLTANLIAECPTFPINEDTRRTEGSGGVLTKRMGWKPHGALNAFQQQAWIVHNYAEAVVAGRLKIVTDHRRELLQLLIDALAAYQKWKASYCAAIQKKEGSHVGRNSDFFQKDWSDLNPQLLALLEPVNAR